MNANAKEVFIRFEKVKEVVEILSEIKKSQESLKEIFHHIDTLKAREEKMFDNWNNQLEDMDEKIEHIVL